MIQSIVWETLLYTLTACMLAFPVAIWFAIYLIEIRKSLFWRLSIRMIRFLTLFPSIMSVILGLALIFPILKLFNIEYSLFMISIVFAVVMIPIMTNRLYEIFKDFSYMLKESIRSLGMTPVQASFYIFIPALKYEILSTFLWSMAIVLGDSLIFYFFAHYLDNHVVVLSEQILRDMISGQPEKLSFMLGLLLFLGVNLIEVVRTLLKKGNES